MEKYKFIEELKNMLFEDLHTDGDISPNILNIKSAHKKYPTLSENIIQEARYKTDWLETYFMHCRHCARPIDIELATKLINSLDYI